MQMGAHTDTLTFMLPPGMERHLVLGLSMASELEPLCELEEGFAKSPWPNLGKNLKSPKLRQKVGAALQE